MKQTTATRTIGICGLGQIGLPLGLACWRSGYRVLLYDREASRLGTAIQQIEKMDSWLNAEMPELKPEYGEFECIPDLQRLEQRTEIVVECIAEDLSAKVALFQALAGAAICGAIFCSCTSGLSVSEMGNRSGFPRQVVGTHFWNPPHLMPLVEVIKGDATSEETMHRATDFCRSIGKRPVRVNADVPGFVGNRMLHALAREAIAIVEQGIASAEDVDTVAKMTFGLRQPVLGPLEHLDLVGLDLIHTIHEYLLSDLAANGAPGKLLTQLVESGRLGLKSGQGFYDWTERDPNSLMEWRDRQVIHQLRRLHREGAL